MIIKASQLSQTRWKNGGGVTTEILRSPLGADDYDYRISAADVEHDGPFSRFDGYDRALIVLEGAGLLLNGEELRPLTPHFFSGETEINAKLISGPIRDLGCIYRRKTHTCSMELLLEAPRASGFYFVVKGHLKTLEDNASARDTLIYDGLEPLEASPDLLCVSIELRAR